MLPPALLLRADYRDAPAFLRLAATTSPPTASSRPKEAVVEASGTGEGVPTVTESGWLACTSFAVFVAPPGC